MNIFITCNETQTGTRYWQVSWTIGTTTTGMEFRTPQAIAEHVAQFPDRNCVYRNGRNDKWTPVSI